MFGIWGAVFVSDCHAHMVSCRYAPLQSRLGCPGYGTCSGSLCNFVLRGVKATTLASLVGRSCSGCSSVSGDCRIGSQRSRLAVEAVALKYLLLFESGVVDFAGGSLIAKELSHSVLFVVHIQGCQDVASVRVQVIERLCAGFS